MDILIETSTGNKIRQWATSPPRVNIPGTGDVVFPAPDDRPLAIGPDHFLAVATVVDEDIGDDQKRGPETVVVVGQEVTVTRTSVDKDADDLMDDWKAEMSYTDRDVPRSTEDIYDALDEDAQGRVVQIIRDRITAKKAAREAKP